MGVFRRLREYGAWLIVCLHSRTSIKDEGTMKLSNAMLINISRQIESGRAITAIATVNQYLRIDSPLRIALINNASKYLRVTGQQTARVLKGEIINQQELMQAILENSLPTKSFIHIAAIPSSFGGRLKFRTTTRKINRSSMTRVRQYKKITNPPNQAVFSTQ